MSASATSLRIAIKNILFTTDFSKASEAALPYAAAFSRWYGSNMFIAHAIPYEPLLRVSMDRLPMEVDPYWQDAQQRMAAFNRAYPLKEIPHDFLMQQGELWHVLSDFIEQYQVDFLVLGTHGRHGLKKLLLGSAAERIFRMASCPVLTVGPKVVHPDVKFESFRNILFATDFSPASVHALPYALSIAEENQAHLILLHLISLVPFQRQETVEAETRNRLRALHPSDTEDWCEPEYLVRIGFPSDGILNVAEEYHADVIVMGVHHAKAPRTAAHLPWAIAYEVVCNAHCPVLTVRG